MTPPETYPWTGADDLDASSPPSEPRGGDGQAPPPVVRKVRVTGTSQPSNWYANRIGEEFEIEEIHPGFFVVRNPGGREDMRYLIAAADCEPVTADTAPDVDSLSAIAERDRRIEDLADWNEQSRIQRDALAAEVERLRTELQHQSALWQTALGHAAQQDAEIKGLRAAIIDKERELLDTVAENSRLRLTLDVRERGDGGDAVEQLPKGVV